jgi:rSAM/selenodomain-associated transferase 2
MPPTISCILPTLNEAKALPNTLESLRPHAPCIQTIVADGGSDDSTLDIARSFNCQTVQCEPGRGAQMNAGARIARAPILLFLHADTRLPEDGVAEIERILARSNVIAGSFRLRFDKRHPLLEFYSRCSAINLADFTYGDQALFIRANTFRQIGGFKAYPFLEDVELQLRLRRQGRFVKSSSSVVTSSRRFHKNGVLKQQLRNFLIVAAYQAGISPFALNRFYRKSR